MVEIYFEAIAGPSRPPIVDNTLRRFQISIPQIARKHTRIKFDGMYAV